MHISSFYLLKIIEILGTFAFAISGAIAAIKSQYNFFGILVLAFYQARPEVVQFGIL